MLDFYPGLISINGGPINRTMSSSPDDITKRFSKRLFSDRSDVLVVDIAAVEVVGVAPNDVGADIVHNHRHHGDARNINSLKTKNTKR